MGWEKNESEEEETDRTDSAREDNWNRGNEKGNRDTFR
jgi:hypothetical protein